MRGVFPQWSTGWVLRAFGGSTPYPKGLAVGRGGDRKSEVFATSRSYTGEGGLGRFALYPDSQHFKSHKKTTTDRRYDNHKHTLPLTASVTQQSLKARDFCNVNHFPCMFTTYVHQSPFVHAIPVVFPRLSQLLIQCLQLSLRLLRVRLRLEVLPPPGVASSLSFF